MTINEILLCIAFGVGTAVLYFFSQRWSVNRLDPQRPDRSVRLILGGTLLRWGLFITAMAISITHSYGALLIVFITFMLFRMLFLLRWQGWLGRETLKFRKL